MLVRIKTFFKENWKFLIFLLLFYLVMSYELPYAIYAPGGAINMSERVKGDNLYSEEGSISMTYVNMIKATVPYYALSHVIANWDLVPKNTVTYDNTSLKDTVEIDKIYMQEAISNAQKVAYDNAGIKYTIKNSKNLVTYISTKSDTQLKYGDEILSIDDVKVNTLKDMQNYISTKNIDDKVTIKYLRDGKENSNTVTLIDLNGEPKVGISIATVNEYSTNYNIEVKTKSSESGPSGGLMTALEIYNKITVEDITKGHKIMGTGTIELDGTVGEIGGVKYKLMGAVSKGADIFICPYENYEEALKVKNEKG